MDTVTLGAALSIMKKMPDTAASSAAAAEDAADRAEEAARTLTIDDTLTESGQAADSKVVGDALAGKLDIADLPDTVSNANQLLSEKYTVDTEPYHFRPSGGNGADREFDTIVGGSVVWNQLISNDIKAVNMVFDDATDIYQHRLASATLSIKSGHKYLFTINGSRIISDNDAIIFSIKTTPQENFARVTFANGDADGVKSIIVAPENDYEQSIGIYANNYYGKQGYGAGDSVSYDNLQLFDLTAMFGSEIADHVYELEQAEAGAGVAWFRKYFPNDYYDYNPGELMHVSGVSAHKLYDAEENVIGNYPLDSSLTLRGIPKLVDGKLSFDGDIYKPDGTVERRYGIVDLGTLAWSVQTAETGVFKSLTLSNLTIKVSHSITANIICDRFISSPAASPMPNNAISVSSVGMLFVKDSEYANISAADFKAAMSGVYFVYELAEPTTEEAEPYTSPQIVDGWGTEEYVSDTIVPVGHETRYPENLRAKIEGLPCDMGMIAPVEKTNKATRNYTAGRLLVLNNTLYKVTANIAKDGTITPGTNVTATTLDEIIAALA